MNGFPEYQLFGEAASSAEKKRAVRESAPLFAAGTSEKVIRSYLGLIILGPACRWGFLSIGKNGSSSTLRVLYEMEFGHPLTVRYASPIDINPSAVIHQLSDAGVFARALDRGMSAVEVRDADMLRLMVVRDPLARAVSAYRYFCRSNAEAAPWFVRDRLRIDAAVGFDWTHMPGTVEGFRRFLRYIELEIELSGAPALDSHWRPQTAFAPTDVWVPGLIGRMEAMDDFYAELAGRLDKPAPSRIPRENRQDGNAEDLMSDSDARRMVEAIYRADYVTFGY